MLPRQSLANLILCSSLAAASLIAAGTARGQTRPGPGGAMGGPLPNPIASPSIFASRSASITIQVDDESGMPLGEQALVKLSSPMNQVNLWRTTQDRSQVIIDGLSPADYEIEVSAAGYETTTQDVDVISPDENYDVFVRLRRNASGEDVGLPGQLLVGKASKEAEKGIADLSAGKWKDAEKHLGKAYRIAPGNADLNYLMAVLCSKTNRTSEAETYLNKAIAMNSKHVRALTLLGELRLRKKDYKEAIGPLQQAVAADVQFWLARWLLADAYLRTGEYDQARQQAELAIQKGKGAATEAELVLGESLANLGHREEAVQAFQTFLRESPGSPAAESVRKFIAQLQSVERPAYKETSATAAWSASASAAPAPLGPRLPVALATSSPDAGLSIPTWHPPSVDEEKLALAAGAVCPANEVIGGAGKSAEKLVDSVGRFEATEQVVDEELDPLGKPLTTARRKFDYMASISEADSRWLKVDESRASLSDEGAFADHISTRGLAALALVFHPLLRDDYTMTCEGLGEWKGQATWLVYFRQRPDRPDRFMSYTFTNAEYWVALKGRAWITADTFQIVHLEADLLNPMPQIELLRQHQSVDYGPVSFKSKHTQLWLPKAAELYFDFRRHRYYRRDSFDNYKLFAVDATEKIGQPAVPDDIQPPQH